MPPHPTSSGARWLVGRRSIAIQRLSNRIQQVLILERLGQECHRTRLHRVRDGWLVVVTADEDGWNLQPGIGQLPLRLEAGHVRKCEIDDETTRRVGPLARQEL